MTLRAFLLGAVAALALPHAASACAQLSQHVWMCDRGTPWETAEWDTAGDGTARFLGELVLAFSEEWPGFEIGDDISTLEERFETYEQAVADDGHITLETLLTDRVTLGDATSVRSIQRDEIEVTAFMSAVMLTQVGSRQIMLYLDAPETTELSEMDQMSRDILVLLKDNCADEISCADDYQRPQAGNEGG